MKPSGTVTDPGTDSSAPGRTTPYSASAVSSGDGSSDTASSNDSRERSLPTTFFGSSMVSRAGAGALAVVLLVLLVAFGAADLAAQRGPGASLASQSMRPYAHVFWAYALAWALVLGWVVSIGRRWSRVEDDLEKQSRSE